MEAFGWNILGGFIAGIVAGFIATGVYQHLTSPSLSLSVRREGCPHINTMFQVLYVGVTNCEHPRFLRWFLRRNTAHSCHARVTLRSSQDSSLCWQAVWLPGYRPPSIPAAARGPGLSFGERPRETVDIDGDACPVIRVAAKTEAQLICYIAGTNNDGALTLDRELAIGEYPLEVEVTCLNLSPVTKKFVLKNKGVATDLEGLVKNFELKKI